MLKAAINTYPFTCSLLLRKGKRLIGFACASGAIGLVGHFILNYATIGELVVGEVKARIRLAVKQHAFHITVAITYARGFHDDVTAITQRHVGVWQIGRTQHILVGARAHGIETQRGEDKPRRHLSTVVVAAQATYVVAVHLIHDGAQAVLRLPRGRSPRI